MWERRELEATNPFAWRSSRFIITRYTQRVRMELIVTYRHVDKFIANVISPFRYNLNVTPRGMIFGGSNDHHYRRAII